VRFQRRTTSLLFNSRLRLFLGMLKSKWVGPFIIKRVKPYGEMEIEDPSNQRSWIVNGQRLKPYLGGEFAWGILDLP